MEERKTYEFVGGEAHQVSGVVAFHQELNEEIAQAGIKDGRYYIRLYENNEQKAKAFLKKMEEKQGPPSINLRF